MLTPDWGGYLNGMITLEGSFLINGSSAPDGVRDGNTNTFTVARDSAGLFTVTFADHLPYMPEKMVTELAWLNPVDSTPVLVCACGVVEGSYSQANRSFKILCTKVADVGASAYFDPAPADPDDNSRVCFTLRGSCLAIGTD